MTHDEFEELTKIWLRIGVMTGQTKINYQRTADVYQWGMSEGMKLAYDILDAWYQKVAKTQNLRNFSALSADVPPVDRR